MADYENMLARLTDFSKPFDVALFDEVVTKFQQTGNADLNKVILSFAQHPNSWTCVDAILQQSTQDHAKIRALLILESAIGTRWAVMDQASKQGIKGFVTNMTIKLATDTTLSQSQRVVLSKLNSVLVQIAKVDWPDNWPTFVQDIVSSSRNSETLCANNMNILLILSEEVFDFSRTQLTTDKVQKLKSRLNSDFAQIFQLCNFIFEKSTNLSLLHVTLKTLVRYLRWVPLDYIVDTDLVKIITMNYFSQPQLQNVALQCLCEIAHITAPQDNPQQKTKLDYLCIAMATGVTEHVFRTIPQDVDINQLYTNSPNNRVQDFLHFLATFYCDLLAYHLPLLESTNQSLLLSILSLVLRISLIENAPTIFTICLDFWLSFLRDLYLTEQRALPQSSMNHNRTNGITDNLFLSGSHASARLVYFEPVLARLRLVLIARMERPTEVLVGVDEFGQVSREKVDNTETTAVYNTMRDIFSFLTLIDSTKTTDILTTELTRVVLSSEWDPNKLNRLCWAIGSIAKSLSDASGQKFLGSTLKALLGLVVEKESKDDKVIVASNIMYIVGQYPRFLKTHFTFLTTVSNKLFDEFMHEKHPGVQDMAVDTFLTICQKCSRSFLIPVDRQMHPVQPQPGQYIPLIQPNQPPLSFNDIQNSHDTGQYTTYLNDIITRLPKITAHLEKSQMYTLYEGIGYLVSQASNGTDEQQQLLYWTMSLQNQKWVEILHNVQTSSPEHVLTVSATIQMLDFILKINTRICRMFAHGHFLAQLSRIFLEGLQIYGFYSQHINNAVAQGGEPVTRTVIIRGMASVRRELLLLIETTLKHASEKEKQQILTEFLPKIRLFVLESYAPSHPLGRESQVLSLYTVILNSLKNRLSNSDVQEIIIKLFGSTVNMINVNFEDFPEYRSRGYGLLQAFLDHHFGALIALPPDTFKLIIDSIFWATKHFAPEIQELGLNILFSLLAQINMSPNAGQFYIQYYILILNQLLEVLTDTFHRGSFMLHAQILSKLIETVKSNILSVSLSQNSGVDHGSNVQYIKNHMMQLFLSSFETVNQRQIETFVNELFETSNNMGQFKSTLNNFLIQLKEFAPHADEMMATLANSQQQQQQQQPDVLQQLRQM